jgi:hypothetical protein
MTRLLASLLVISVAVVPAAAAPRHRASHRFHHSGEAGMPITAERDSIRINSVGQVISQPVPVIEKERNFNSRAQQDLRRTPAAPPAPSQAPQQP